MDLVPDGDILRVRHKPEYILRRFGMSDVAETNDIKIDFSQIPEHVRDELASSTIEAVNEFLRQPGGREFLDKKIALRKARIEAQ